MNINTGEIHDLDKLPKSELEKIKESLVEVDPKDMTKKQKETMQVSLKDHKSKLGKKLTK